MELKKVFTWLPIALALIGSLYTGINVVSTLNNTIAAHTILLSEHTQRIASVDEKYGIEIKNLTQKYNEAREELVIQMTDTFSRITEIRIKAEALRDSSFKMASAAELRALEESYYKLSDELNQLTYDIKDLKRELTGGY